MSNAPEIQATVHPLYAVPLLQGIIADAEPLNRDLAALFLRREAEGERWRNKETYDTQHGIFESDFNLHEWPEPCVQHLFTAIRSTLLTFIQGINAYSDEQMAQMELDMHSWFHITRRAASRAPYHPNASWSAIYCIDAGDDDLTAARCASTIRGKASTCGAIRPTTPSRRPTASALRSSTSPGS